MHNFWILLGVFFWIDSAFALFQGFKKFSLHQSEYSSFLSHAPKYVGGDAYNFIIYANQATACTVLGCSFIIAGLLCFILYNITKPKEEKKIEKSAETAETNQETSDINKV